MAPSFDDDADDANAEFGDGWDDDVDDLLEDISTNDGLDNDDDDGGDDGHLIPAGNMNTQSQAADVGVAASAAATADADADADGWDDDDDLNFDDDWGDDGGEVPAPTPAPAALPPNASNPFPSSSPAAGFVDDEDQLTFPSAAAAPTTTTTSTPVVPNPPPPPQPPSYQQQQQQHQTASSNTNTNNFGDSQDDDDLPVDGDGWDDDDDDELNFDDDGWGDDDDDDDDDDQGGETNDVVVGNDNINKDTAATSTSNNSTMMNMTSQPPQPPPPQMQSQIQTHSSNEYKIQNLHQELEKYVSSLGHMSSSINAVLEYEYNTPQKAQELIDYYTNRPALAEYTRSKELPRMDYQIVLPYGQGVETDKSQILVMGLLPDESLVARASNQSLLADLLQVLTGRDMIVRPQYLAICVAKYCKFTIHLEDYDNIVDCQARLYLSLPTLDETQQQRLDVAEIFVSVVFAPDQGTVQYRVQTINVLLKDMDQLQHAAQFLAEMDLGHDDYDSNSPFTAQPGNSFRDAFLENSQKFFTQSTEGFSQALQQMDSVINLKSKLNTISKFIPDTDVIAAAEQEAMELAQARQQQEVEQQQQHDRYRQSNVAAPVLPHQGTHQGTQFPRPPPPPPPAAAHHDNHRPPVPQHGGVTDDASRPQSILGGFFKTLASSVTLPDENPALYGQPDRPEIKMNPSRDQIDEMPMLYRRDDETPPSQLRNSSTQPQADGSVPHITNTAESQAHISSNVDRQRANYLIDDHQHNENSFENETHFQASPHAADEQIQTAIEPTHVEDPNSQPDVNVLAPTSPSSAIAPDGWDDDMDDDAIDLDLSATGTTSVDESPSKEVALDVPFPHKFSPNRDIQVETNAIVRDVNKRPKPIVEKPHQSKEDNVVETRKRWMNPRPHRPYIIE